MADRSGLVGLMVVGEGEFLGQVSLQTVECGCFTQRKTPVFRFLGNGRMWVFEAAQERHGFSYFLGKQSNVGVSLSVTQRKTLVFRFPWKQSNVGSFTWRKTCLCRFSWKQSKMRHGHWHGYDYEWVQLNRGYHHVKLERFHFFFLSVWETTSVKVFSRDLEKKKTTNNVLWINSTVIERIMHIY